VVGLVYVAAFAPDEGEILGDIVGKLTEPPPSAPFHISFGRDFMARPSHAESNAEMLPLEQVLPTLLPPVRHKSGSALTGKGIV
jgi:hypothetical protein